MLCIVNRVILQESQKYGLSEKEFLEWPLVAVVAQLVEPRIVIPIVAGSSPVNRPKTCL